MTGENIKDLRLMLDMVSKDYQRLADDMKALSDYIRPFQVELMLREKDENVENI